MNIHLNRMSVLLLGLAALVEPVLTSCRFDASGLPFSASGDQRLSDGPALQDARVDPHPNDLSLRADQPHRRDSAASDSDTLRPDQTRVDLRVPDRSTPDLPRPDVASSLPCNELFENNVDNYDLCIETPSTCAFYFRSDQQMRTCNEVCSSGKLCLGAYEDVADQCSFIAELDCDHHAWDCICMCLR